MEKKKQRLLSAIWIVIAAMSRILYFLIVREAAVDTYAYVENALAKTGAETPVLSSGLAYAYTEKLFDLLRLFGNHSAVLVGFQAILQILWLVLIFISVRLLWGELAGYVTGTILLVSPFMFQIIKVVEPANFLLFHWAVLLFLLSVFQNQTAKRGWFRSNSGELFLILIGFYLGVVCTWNYIGFGLLAVMVYVLIQNHKALSEKLWMQKNLNLEENEQIMSITSQGLIIIAGIFVGMFATLMKYTGITGWTIWEQLFWWQDQFLNFSGRCQDVSVALPIWLIAAFGLGLIGQHIVDVLVKKKAEKKEYEDILRKDALKEAALQKEQKNTESEDIKEQYVKEDVREQYIKEECIKDECSKENCVEGECIKEDKPEEEFNKEKPFKTVIKNENNAEEEEFEFDFEEDMLEFDIDVEDEEMTDEFFKAKDGRVIKYIENPLPGPKKHVKKEMDFEILDMDISENEEKVDDFDYKIDPKNDFDFD